MGGGDSRLAPPSFPMARARFEAAEYRDIVKGVESLGAGTSFTREEFCLKFPADGQGYAKLLFAAVQQGPVRDRIGIEQFIPGFSMIAKGPQMEQASFCFSLFDPSGSGRISAPQMHRSLATLCEAAFSMSIPLFHIPSSSAIAPNKEEHQAIVADVARRAMGGLPELKFVHFSTWILSLHQLVDYVDFSLQQTVLKRADLTPTLSALRQQPPLMLQDDKSLLTSNQAMQIRSWLPEPYCKGHFFNIFSTKSHGFALNTVYRNFETKLEQIMKEPSILVIEDTSGHVFGGFFAQGWFRNAEKFYGSEESFLFSLLPQRNVYRCTGEDDHVMYTTPDLLAAGGKLQYFGLSLDAELVQGKSHPCLTFGSPQLAGMENFKISAVQLWCIIDVANTKVLFDIDSDDDLDVEFLREKEVAGPSIWDREESWVLDQLKGVGYSRDLAPPPEFEESDLDDEGKRKLRVIKM